MSLLALPLPPYIIHCHLLSQPLHNTATPRRRHLETSVTYNIATSRCHRLAMQSSCNTTESPPTQVFSERTTAPPYCYHRHYSIIVVLPPPFSHGLLSPIATYDRLAIQNHGCKSLYEIRQREQRGPTRDNFQLRNLNKVKLALILINEIIDATFILRDLTLPLKETRNLIRLK